MIQIAMQVAQVMATRSEDPFTKVGCVALTKDNRMIATAYNGLLPGVTWMQLAKFIDPIPEVEENPEREKQVREARLPFMVHAEQNLCSLIRRYNAQKCVTTVCPCPSCLLLLAAHGIKEVYYAAVYNRDKRAIDIAKFYDITLKQL